MSFTCGKHGWRHLLNSCPSCQETVVSNSAVNQVTKADDAVQKHKLKYDNAGASYHDSNDCPACGTSKQLCICSEINARHCPVHADDNDPIGWDASDAYKPEDFPEDDTAEQASKPREWFLVDESTDAADKTDRWAYGRFSTELYNHLPLQFQIKVIEKSAYDDLNERYEQACDSDNAWRESAEKLIKERDSQELELRELRGETAWTRAENSNLIEQRGALSAELKEQLLVNGKGQQRELRLITERDALRAENERLQHEELCKENYVLKMKLAGFSADLMEMSMERDQLRGDYERVYAERDDALAELERVRAEWDEENRDWDKIWAENSALRAENERLKELVERDIGSSAFDAVVDERDQLRTESERLTKHLDEQSFTNYSLNKLKAYREERDRYREALEFIKNEYSHYIGENERGLAAPVPWHQYIMRVWGIVIKALEQE